MRSIAFIWKHTYSDFKMFIVNQRRSSTPSTNIFLQLHTQQHSARMLDYIATVYGLLWDIAKILFSSIFLLAVAFVQSKKFLKTATGALSLLGCFLQITSSSTDRVVHGQFNCGTSQRLDHILERPDNDPTPSTKGVLEEIFVWQF